MRTWFSAVGCVAFTALMITGTRSDDRLAGRACRSVHLRYDAGRTTAFYNEVTVDRSAPGTYFCAHGWGHGYFGIQELGNGKKLVIFSVWDSQQNDPKAVPNEQRVKLVHRGERVRVGRFGGEGSGGQSFLDYDWKPGATYRFLTTAKVVGERTEFSGHFRGPDDPDWIHMITFSTITGGKTLDGHYSFVEDFQRDRVSLTKERKARYGPPRARSEDGRWHVATRARFTADSNPATNIDAGAENGRFFLATGGTTTNSNTKLKGEIVVSIPKGTMPELPESMRSAISPGH